jgi:hypothetical protein
MSLVSGVWMISIQSYQILSLKLQEQEQKRAQIKSQWNDIEMGVDKGVLKGESARVSGGNRSIHVVTQSTTQGKR